MIIIRVSDSLSDLGPICLERVSASTKVDINKERVKLTLCML